MRCLNRDYTTDVFDYLLAVERKPLGELRTSRITRACVVNWLMKVNVSKKSYFVLFKNTHSSCTKLFNVCRRGFC